MVASVKISKIIDIDEKNFLSLEECSIKVRYANNTYYASEGFMHSRYKIPQRTCNT
jgi:hypothetical protein